jgi:hypothetical protein
MHKFVLIAASFVALLSACSSSSDDASPAASPSAELSGTWEGTGTRYGTNPMSISITVNSGTFKVTVDSGSFEITPGADGLSAAYLSAFHSNTIVATNSSASALDLGSFPFKVAGGVWSLNSTPADSDYGCSLNIAASAISGSCNLVKNPKWFPWVDHAQSSCAKTESRASIFGDLGGIWNCTSPSGATCTFTFDGNSVASSCGNAVNRLKGNMSLVFNGSTASGSTDAGYEFSAHRL